MASVSLQTMKDKVASAYSGASWQYKVYHQMRDNQIVALYFKFLQDGTFDRQKQRKKVERENEKNSGHQMNIFDWLKERS